MATLRNVHGGSLIPDFATPITQGVERVQGRRREAADQANLQDLIRGSLGLPQQPQQNLPSGEGLFGQLSQGGGLLGGRQRAGQTPGIIPEKQEQSAGLLGRIAPGLAQAIGQVRGNPDQEDAIRTEAETGAALATELRGMKDHGARVRRMAEVSGDMVGKGQDIGRVTQLANMSPDQLDLELMKMEMVGREVATQLPPRNRQDAIAELMAVNPQLGGVMLARRDREIAAEQAARAAAARRAQAARAPKTALGKDLAQVRADIASGAISQEVGDQLLTNLRTAATAVDAPEFSGEVPEGMMFADPSNPRAGVVPIPGAVPEATPIAEAKASLAELGVTPEDPRYTPTLEAAAGVVLPEEKVPAEIETLRARAVDGGLEPGTPEYQRFMLSDGKAVGPVQPDFEGEQKLRKEFTALPVVKDFSAVDDAFARIEASASEPSAAGDLALVFNYMKLLDPGSVVRESEFATAANATAWLQETEEGRTAPAPVARAIRKLNTGEILAPAQRADFINQAGLVHGAQLSNYTKKANVYRDLATEYGLEPDRIVSIPAAVDETVSQGAQMPPSFETVVSPQINSPGITAQDIWDKATPEQRRILLEGE